jgi:O-antigen ligase
MPEHLRALVYILAMATVVFMVARAPATAIAIDPADYRRRRNLWFILTILSFVSGDFWIFVIVAGIVLLVAQQAEQNKTALFLALLYAVPAVTAVIPGFGLLQQLFAMTPPRLLSLTILLPAFLALQMRPDTVRFGRLWPDRFLLGYLIVSFGVALYATTFTNVLRHAVFYAFLDIFLPYYVASRGIRDLKMLRDTMMTFVVVAVLLSVIAVFEYLRGWLLYSYVIGTLGDVIWGFGYLSRAGSVRAQASAGHAIALGFVLALGLCTALYARTLVARPMTRRAILVMLIAGLVASLSRGPWIGAAAGILVFIGSGAGAARQLAKAAMIGMLALLLLQLTPIGRTVLDLLPFVGSTEGASVEYRQNLMTAAFEVIWNSPWFGGVDIYSAENVSEIMSTGPGQAGVFVDLVNTYIGTLLASGFVGLFFFSGAFAAVITSVWRSTRQATDDEYRLVGRALLAVLFCVIVTIFTTSSITVIGTTYWCFAGLALAYAQLLTASGRKAIAARSNRTVEPRVDRPPAKRHAY